MAGEHSGLRVETRGRFDEVCSIASNEAVIGTAKSERMSDMLPADDQHEYDDRF